MNSLGLLLSLALSVSHQPTVASSTTSPPATPEAHGFVGTGIAMMPRYLGADETLVLPVLLGRLDYRGMSAEVRGLGARFDLLPLDTWAAGLSMNVRLPRRDRDGPFDGAGEVSQAVEVGAFVGHDFICADQRMGLTLDTEVRTAVNGVYHGVTVGGGASFYKLVGKRLTLGLDASVTYFGQGFADTYFSVDSATAAATGLQVYEASAGLGEATLGSTLGVNLTRSWRVVGRVSVNQLLGDAKSSPVVQYAGRATGLTAGLGLAWSF